MPTTTKLQKVNEQRVANLYENKTPNICMIIKIKFKKKIKLEKKLVKWYYFLTIVLITSKRQRTLNKWKWTNIIFLEIEIVMEVVPLSRKNVLVMFLTKLLHSLMCLCTSTNSITWNSMWYGEKKVSKGTFLLCEAFSFPSFTFWT